MPLGISPLVDFACKLMLASCGHESVTIHFLNAILGKQAKISSVEIQNPLVGPNYDGDKWVILDILAKDDRGRKFNIEMQTSIPAGLPQRLAFYDARLYVEQMREGDRYHELRPAIVICVLDKTLLKDRSQLHSDFRFRNELGDPLTNDLQVHLLELTKLSVTRENLGTATPEEKWAYFLLNADKMSMEEIKDLFPDPEFVEAAGVLEVIKNTPEQMDNYISRLKYQLDEVSRMESVRIEALMEGETKGRTEGRMEGRVEGRVEGELIGRIESFQEILGISEPTHDELCGYDMPKLTALCDQLRLQIRSRRSD
ncbi:MAG: Rpn family recombination-promoting nuclease/putative transposase [Planctomycetaceae bacterium]